MSYLTDPLATVTRLPGQVIPFLKPGKATIASEPWISYINSAGRRLDFAYDRDWTKDQRGCWWIGPRLRVDGQRIPADPNNWPVTDSPVVTLQNQILHVRHGHDCFRVNWQSRLPTITAHRAPGDRNR
jgi:hypothetical protein